MKFILVLVLMLMFSQNNTAELTLTVTGVTSNEGVVRVLLFQLEDGFPDEPDKAVRNASVEIKNGQAVIKFSELWIGEYAISVFHDSRNTGKLRTNVLGIPKDGYGFSNNSMGTFGPPSFKQAAFVLKPGANVHEIKLR